MSNPTCSFEGCGRKHYARGLCNGHYQQQRSGAPLAPLREHLTFEERVWSRVERTGTCWVWTGEKKPKGYGAIGRDGATLYAHRVVWEMVRGPIPEGMQLDHRCHEKTCVNPDHLRLVTNAQNHQNLSGAYANSTTGVRGVTRNPRNGKWVARVTFNYRNYSGGTHDTLAEAEAAAIALRKRLFTHDDHDEWAHRIGATQD